MLISKSRPYQLNSKHFSNAGRPATAAAAQEAEAGAVKAEVDAAEAADRLKETMAGHLQKVCNSRIRAGVPEVDAQGKPYSHGNEMDPEDEDYEGDTSKGNPWEHQQQDQHGWDALQEVYNDTPDFL